MKLSYQILIVAFVVTLAGGLIWSANHYHTKYQDEKRRADTAEHDLSLAKQTITDMQTRQRDVAALDAKYTKELADAQATIDLLHDDVATGKRRLQLNAKCPARNATGTASVDDATSPKLADAAERNYWTLRSRIEIAGKQIAGLQRYINEQCRF